ncbi:sentrin-specific protease 6-like [Neocloeon triangulifer]|uniref:sentrin-specific protease 6-like n=1 Tax=Neocloeon triangulifer TaxID=2078957 RepID=UPI00286EC8E6|nr:sentrin-specific protease 6-like [Neocloeon triangulifer]XP_059474078.1 sentrin-specific protease 6-like [Neocloeon triangulifer]
MYQGHQDLRLFGYSGIMDEGQHLPGVPTAISIQDTPTAANVELVDASEGIYRIVTTNGIPYGVCGQQLQTTPAKTSGQIIQQMAGNFQNQHLQMNPNFILQNPNQQGSQSQQRIVLDGSSQKYTVYHPQVFKVMPSASNIIMVSPNAQQYAVRNVQQFQEKLGIEFAKQPTPMKIQASPPRPPQPNQLSPPRPPQPNQSTPPAPRPCQLLLTPLRPVTPAVPQLIPFGNKHQPVMSPQRTQTTPPIIKKPPQILKHGNQNYNIISSTSCKAVPISSFDNSNENEEMETEQPPPPLPTELPKTPPPPPPPPLPQVNEARLPLNTNCSTPKVSSSLVKNSVLLSSSSPKFPTSPMKSNIPPQSSPTTQLTQAKAEEKDTIMKMMPGKVAICKNCGLCSIDLSRCQRCNRVFPPDVRIVDDPSLVKARKQPNNSTGKSYLKNVAPLNKHSPAPPIPSTSKLKTAVSTTAAKPVGLTSKLKPALQQSPARQPPIIIKNKRAVPVKKPTVAEEPVCLTISDDEDDSAASRLKPAPTPVLSVEKCIVISKEAELSSTITDKEPSIEELQITEHDMKLSLGIGNNLIENYQKGHVGGGVTMKCRTVRVGSYKVAPLENVLICPEGVRISLPHPETKVPLVIEVPRSSIVTVLAHMGRSVPVLFFYVRCSTADKIRVMLSMTDASKEPYFDPLSKNETRKRITILPEKLSDETKILLKNIFGKAYGRDIMTMLEYKEANALLVKASPMSNESVSGTKSRAKEVKPIVEESKELFVYPKPPLKGGIPITTFDYLCLGEEQFLNDAIVDFYLKYLTLTKLTEFDQARTHIFSSFFYRRLTTKQLTRKSDANTEKLSASEQRHARVKSWTKNIDIFEKDFIFIPINEHAHWFLAVICFPGLEGPVRFCDGQPVPAELLNKPKQATAKVTIEGGSGVLKQFTIGATTVTLASNVSPNSLKILQAKNSETIIALEDSEGSERDEAEGDEDEFETEEETEAEQNQEQSAVEKEAPVKIECDYIYPPDAVKQPCILIFDSLPTNRRGRVVATLREYLRIEYKVKKGKERDFNKDNIRGSLPKIPHQNNFTDCGLFMLQYAESFFEHPIRDFCLPLKSLLQWFEENTIRTKREYIAKLIQKMMAEQGVKVKLPELTFAKPLTSGTLEVVGKSIKVVIPPEPNELKPELQSICPAEEVPGEVETPRVVSLSVIVPEEHVLPPVEANIESEILVSEDFSKCELNDTGGSNDPEDMEHCIQLVDQHFPNDDPTDFATEDCADSSSAKRKAECDSETISPKRVC